MDHLIELSQLVSPSRIRYQNLIGEGQDKVERLYHFILDNKEIDNVQAKEYLFSNKNNKENLLWRAKTKLNDRLVNSLLVLQYEKGNIYKNTFIKAQKELAVCQILRVEGKKKAFELMAGKVLKTAIEFDFTEIVYLLAKELRFQYSLINSKPKKAQKFTELISEYRQYLDIEDELERIYCEFILLIKRRKNFTKVQIDKAKELMKNASILYDKRKTYWTVVQVANIRAFYYQMLNDHNNTAKVCEEALNTLNQLPYAVPASATFSFILKMIPGQIMTQQFEGASINIQKCLKRSQPGQINWAITKQAEVISLFHQSKYDQVLKITSEIQNFPQNYWSKESWSIYQAYASILTGKKLRLGKFLNEVPQFSRDTRGMNINILIIQILEYMRRNERGQVIDRTNALKQYIYRHLRHQDTIRSNCFIKMLICLEKGYFKQITVSKYAKPHLQKLLKNPLHDSKQDFEVEIVPYEHLWSFLLQLMESQKPGAH